MFSRTIARCLASSATTRSRPIVPFIPGDGVGPLMIDCTKKLWEACEVKADFIDIGGVSEKLDDRLHEENPDLQNAIEALIKYKVCLKGHILARPESHVNPISLQIRLNRDIGAFARVTEFKSFEGLKAPRHNNLDFVVIREITEGEYCGEEHEIVPGVVESLKVTTEYKSEQICRVAFDYAVQNGRKKVTCVHKANIMKKGDGLFMRIFNKVAEDYPQIESETMIVDNTCMQAVSNPWQFDVMVMPNLYGNIVENLGAGLVGGAGLVPCKHIGPEVVKFGPAARYTFRSAENQNIANPTAMMLASADLLDHINDHGCATRIRDAIFTTIRKGESLTQDMGGSATCHEYTKAVMGNLVSH